MHVSDTDIYTEKVIYKISISIDFASLVNFFFFEEEEISSQFICQANVFKNWRHSEILKLRNKLVLSKSTEVSKNNLTC